MSRGYWFGSVLIPSNATILLIFGTKIKDSAGPKSPVGINWIFELTVPELSGLNCIYIFALEYIFNLHTVSFPTFRFQEIERMLKLQTAIKILGSDFTVMSVFCSIVVVVLFVCLQTILAK